jgi:regulator of protease activity HflC (stomatin/prohibitin superfamily)
VISVLLQALILGVSAMVVLLILTSVIKIVREHERGVIFRLGRIQGGPKGPGLFLLIPVVDRMVRIDLGTFTMDVPPQEVITRDNVPLRVSAVIFFRVVDPIKSVIEVENHIPPTSRISTTTLESVFGQRVLAHAKTTLRSVLGQRDFDDLLSNREAIDEELRKIMDEQTEPWGIQVSKVIVKDVELPEELKRDMARRAESERESRRASGSA